MVSFATGSPGNLAKGTKRGLKNCADYGADSTILKRVFSGPPLPATPGLMLAPAG